MDNDDQKKAPVAPEATAVDNLPICLATARSIESKHWKHWLGTWEEFKQVLSEHPETSTKDGLCYLPGKLNGTERKKNAVERLDLLVLDSDRGADLKEIASRLRALGYAAVVHSSYSHLSCQSLVKFDDYKRHTGTGEVTAEGAQAYLIDKKGFRPEVLGDVTIIEAMRSTPNGIFIVVGHAPIQKGRIIVLLAKPYIIMERMQAQGLTQRQAQELWAANLTAFAVKIGVGVDEACKDVSRGFYFASHPPGAPYYFEAIPGRALDLAELNAAVATSVKEKTRLARPGKKTNGPSPDLLNFAAKYSKTFLLATPLKPKRLTRSAV